MKNLFSSKRLVTAFVLATSISCSTNDIIENTEEITELTSVKSSNLIDLGVGGDSFFEEFSEAREITNSEELGESNEDYGDTRIVCTTKTVSVEDGTSDFQLFGGLSSDVIYPGNLLQGASVVDLSIATPSIIPLDRAEGTISINLNGGVDTPSVTVDEVKTSTIQSAINEIINSSSGAVPANFSLDIEQIESEEQLALEMGLSFEGWGAKASADLSFSKEKEFNRTLVKLKQTYYTINYDTPTKPEDIFADYVTLEDYEPYISADNPATFISSVAYGRIFYMLVESTSSREEMQANLSFAYNGFGTSTEGSLDVSAFESLNDLKIKVIAYGGDAAGAIALAGETSVSAIANKLAEGTNIQTALPLSYKVRSVYDPAKVVGVKLATEFDVVTCEEKGTLPPTAYLGLVGLFDDGIGAAVQIKESIVLLFNVAGDKYAFYNAAIATVLKDSNNNSIFDFNNIDGPLGGSSFDNIGAAYLRRDNNMNDRIIFFDATGLHKERMDIDPSEFSIGMTSLPENMYHNYSNQVTSNQYFINNFSGDYPLGADNAVDAAYFAEFNGVYPNDSYHYLVDNGGSMARSKHRDDAGKRVWRDIVTPEDRGFLLHNIGAAGTVELGGARQHILFDMTGENMSINTNGTKSGPFVVN